MMHALLLSAMLLASQAQAPAPTTPEAPAAEKEMPGVIERAIDSLPPVLWSADAPFAVRLNKVTGVAMFFLGVTSLLLAGAGALLTAAMQLSPYPKDSDFRQRPRSIYIWVAMAM